ncbi:hypothetical protein NST02_04970 [Robertmurraya sp. FSL W8-0741]|uniref:hypothetical protein n=1 Tax=Robertmurraya sp. FSL W8-0741 TaxID=2954629 RepID=UPI0030F71D88
MPLDNTASIKDIITSLQNLEGINAKAELASVIGSPVTDEDTMSTMVNQIQTSKNELAGKIGEGTEGTEPLQSLVDKVFVGKKWANGLTPTTGSGVFEIARNTATVTMNKFIFEGLSFRPSFIVAKIFDGSIKTSITTYLVGGDTYYQDTVKVATFIDGSSTETTFNLKVGVRDAYVSASGFCLPVLYAGTVEWYAYA